MKLIIKALDTLTFGTGKPTVRGEDTFSAGMFPPFPSVVRGAARAAWLYENGTFDIAGTSDDPTMQYYISEYSLLLDNTPHFPVPSDYLWDDDKKSLVRCGIRGNDGLSSLTSPIQLWAEVDGKVVTAERRYVPLKAMQAYLNGEALTESVALTDYSTDESKVGIYIERNLGTAKKRMLYRSPLVRPTSVKGGASIAANISGVETVPGLTRFGGENKVAHFGEYCGEISPAGAIGENGIFRLYLATPAIFKSGYLPKLPVSAKLLTAAVYGYDSVGGFDMKTKRPKPMRRAVKAGSVYYYKLSDNDAESREAILRLHSTSLSDYSREDGFGICYIGKIKEDLNYV